MRRPSYARLLLPCLLALAGCARPPEPVSCGPECDEYKVCNERGRLWKTPFTFPVFEMHGGRFTRPTYRGGDTFVLSRGDTALYLDALKPYFEAGLGEWGGTQIDGKPRVIVPPHACVVEQVFYGSRDPMDTWSNRNSGEINWETFPRSDSTAP